MAWVAGFDTLEVKMERKWDLGGDFGKFIINSLNREFPAGFSPAKYGLLFNN